MTRRQLRYRLYRIRTANTGGPGHGQTKAFREGWEGQEHFDGWENFALTWDVNADGSAAVVREE